MANTNSASPGQRVTYKTNAGLNLVGDTWGDPSHPPILFLHGGGQTRFAWGGTARTLAAQGWHTVSLDLRGHGESDWAPDGNYVIDSYVDDIRSVLRHFPQKPVFVGASLGGITSLITIGEASEPVASGVVLVDITPRTETEGVERIRAFMGGAPNGFANLEEAADAVAAYIPHRPRPKDLSGLAKNLRLGADGRYRWHWDPQMMNPARFRRDPERLLAASRALKVPTLLVRGKLSDVISDATVQEFLDAVPHAKYADVTGAGHMVAGDQNDIFSKAVIDFLVEVKPI